jgi:hypothetical protein
MTNRKCTAPSYPQKNNQFKKANKKQRVKNKKAKQTRLYKQQPVDKLFVACVKMPNNHASLFPLLFSPFITQYSLHTLPKRSKLRAL